MMLEVQKKTLNTHAECNFNNVMKNFDPYLQLGRIKILPLVNGYRIMTFVSSLISKYPCLNKYRPKLKKILISAILLCYQVR